MLQTQFSAHKFLLGSQSPRRQELLKGLGIEFEVVRIQSDESYPSDLQREEITEYISAHKAQAYFDLKPNEILITADTLVWFDGEVLGKPQSKEEAYLMIQKLSGQIHQVFTSVTVSSTEKTITFSEATDVEFDEFTAEEINYYIENFNPFDKAGGYGIQDWLGYAKVKGIKGCYYNVMGLPLRKLYQVLRNDF